MALYEVELRVREVRGRCPLYREGDVIVLRGFYIDSKRSAPVCMHAFLAMSSLLSAFSHGTDATDLGIGKEKDIGYLQCPDPGPPCTTGGTVVFEVVRRGRVEDEISRA